MKLVFIGKESSGKSLALAHKCEELLKRNKKWHKKFGFKRLIYSNLKFSTSFEEENKEYLRYWETYNDLITLSGADILIDEISIYFPASKGALPLQVNRWLRQATKRGIEIYGTTQEFENIQADFRRRINKIYKTRKVFGSKRGGACLPPVKNIFGVIALQEFEVFDFIDIKPTWRFKFFYFTKKLCSIFDTFQVIDEIEGLPLSHSERKCKVCGYVQIRHS